MYWSERGPEVTRGSRKRIDYELGLGALTARSSSFRKFPLTKVHFPRNIASSNLVRHRGHHNTQQDEDGALVSIFSRRTTLGLLPRLGVRSACVPSG